MIHCRDGDGKGAKNPNIKQRVAARPRKARVRQVAKPKPKSRHQAAPAWALL